MKLLFSLVLAIISTSLCAQVTTKDYAIRITATVQTTPPGITLNWDAVAGNNNISIYRKSKNATSWGTAITQVAGNVTTYTDNTVQADSAYEYYLYKSASTSPRGYIYAGIKQPAIHNRGAILLLVDSALIDSCKTEITTLMQDLRGDGWEVLRRDVLSTTPATTVKSYIVSTYNSQSNLEAVYVLGHVAIPHSGNINPDAHTNHVGAWAADSYYADVDGNWTDNAVNNTSSSNSKNHNIPGDGKFDNSTLPSSLELQVGRVDLYDMPAFSKTTIQLIKSYLNKAHNYKTGQLKVTKRALIDDNFNSPSYFPEAFAANGWRNFPPLVGKDSVSTKDFISNLNSSSYQWAYGCGGGSYTKANGIGTTSDIASNDMNAIFTILFGSYFGDWDYKNSFLRSPLCANTPSLVSFWAGRPNWYLHHMALGEHIGYSARLSQNNSFYNPTGFGARWVHTSLMGDPSLRTEYVKPATNISINKDPKAGATISWTATTEADPAGYYIYRSTSEYGKYTLRSGLVTTTSFTDSFGKDGSYWYMVRAAKVQMTPSGSYYNLSIGEAADAGNVVYPHDEVSINTLANTVDKIELYPNPAVNTTNIELQSSTAQTSTITIVNIDGKVVQRISPNLIKGKNLITIDVKDLTTGMYFIYVKALGSTQIFKLAKTY